MVIYGRAKIPDYKNQSSTLCSLSWLNVCWSSSSNSSTDGYSIILSCKVISNIINKRQCLVCLGIFISWLTCRSVQVRANSIQLKNDAMALLPYLSTRLKVKFLPLKREPQCNKSNLWDLCHWHWMLLKTVCNWFISTK